MGSVRLCVGTVGPRTVENVFTRDNHAPSMSMVNHPQPLAGGVVNDFQFILVNSFVLSPLVR